MQRCGAHPQGGGGYVDGPRLGGSWVGVQGLGLDPQGGSALRAPSRESSPTAPVPGACSATVVDTADPRRVCTFQEYVQADNVWAVDFYCYCADRVLESAWAV